jgi:hypothetical protein
MDRLTERHRIALNRTPTNMEASFLCYAISLEGGIPLELVGWSATHSRADVLSFGFAESLQRCYPESCAEAC